MRHGGNDLDRRSSAEQQRGPINRILHDPSESDAVRGAPLLDLVQCRGIHEENYCRRSLFDRVLCWEYNR